LIVPELPEVELLLRRISPDILGLTIRDAAFGNVRVIRPHTPGRFRSAIRDHRIEEHDLGAHRQIFEGVTHRRDFLIAAAAL
jgi:formamidopyrimidine-DNA glycosylase